MSAIMPTLPHSARRAVTLRMPYKRYYVAEGKKLWQVIDPLTGQMTTMNPDEFNSRMVLENQCPPQAQKLFQGMPVYSAWKFNHKHPAQRR